MISRIITLSKSVFFRFFLLGLVLALTQEPFNLPYCTFLVLPLVSFLVIRFLTSSNDYLLAGLVFGNGYFGTTAITSAGSNGNGLLFEYDVPSGHYGISTKNIASNS